ncbi:MAG TPA: LamG domain-containing protein [Polyangiaceae bacterium]|nr:LamG domain-containing protein [Polyangiaceae bacterium]
MAPRLRLGAVLVLAVTPSACTLLDPLSGLVPPVGDDGGGDAVAADANGDAPDVGTSDTWTPPTESGSDAPHDATTDSQSDSSTMDVVVKDTTPPSDVQDSAALAYYQVVAADSPQAYWRLDEAAGSTTAHDATGNGHNGTYKGGVTLGAAGAIANDQDTAVTFDGASGYVDVPSAFAFAAMSNFTLEAWLKPTDVSDYHAWIGRNDGQPPTEGYLGYIDPAGPFYEFERTDSGTKIYANGSTAPAVGTWAYVVVTYKSGVGSTVWVNGQAGATEATDVSLAGATSDFVIGAENAGATSWWAGEIDEVAVYDYVLAAASIQQHYAVGTGQ